MAVPCTDLCLGRWQINLNKVATLLNKSKNVCSTPYLSASSVLFHGKPSDISPFKGSQVKRG